MKLGEADARRAGNCSITVAWGSITPRKSGQDHHAHERAILF
jgi:hypothetical protein